MAFKNVALHGLLSLALGSVIFLRRSFCRWPSWFSLIFSCVILLPLWIFRLREGGTPFYPADAIIWPQLLPPGVAEIWSFIAHPVQEMGWERWSGLPKFLGQIPLLTAAIGSLTIAWAYLRRRETPLFSQAAIGGLIACFGLYLAIWPAFYHSGIYARFLAPLTAFLLFAFIYLGARTHLLKQSWFPLLALGLLANSGSDVKFAKLKRSWDKTGYQTLAEQEPTLEPIRWGQRHLKTFNRMVSSRPEKYFFSGLWLYGVNSWASYHWFEQLRTQLEVGALASSIDAVIIPKDFEYKPASYDKTGFSSYLISSIIPYCERNWHRQDFTTATLYYDPANLK